MLPVAKAVLKMMHAFFFFHKTASSGFGKNKAPGIRPIIILSDSERKGLPVV